MITAALYARISSDPNHDELGVTRQLEDCQSLCLKRGWQIGPTFTDNDLSAYQSSVVRPAFQSMLKAVEAGTVGAIVTYDADRLTRQPLEWETIISLVDRKGIALATCSGDLDLSTDQGKFMARIMGATARKSSDDTRRRIQRKQIELAQAGRPSGGGLRAYGYADNRISIVEAEAAIIREVVARFLSGDSIKGICADLDQRKISTVSGRFGWRTSSLKQIITSGRIAGRRYANGVDMAAATWPAIVPLSDVLKVRGRLEARDPQARTVRTYALTGLVFCGTCGGPLRGAGSRHGHRRYGCVKDAGTSGRCASIFIRATDLENYIRTDAVSRLMTLTDGDHGNGQAVTNVVEIEARLHASERILGELYRDAAHVPDFASRLATLRDAIAADEATLRQQTPQAAALSDLIPKVKGGGNWAASSAAWQRLEPQRQRKILGLVYDRIEIGPGKPGRAAKGRFQSERVTTYYTDGTSHRPGQPGGLIPPE